MGKKIYDMMIIGGGVHELYQAMETRTASAGGVLSSTTFEPHYNPSISVSDPVAFKIPSSIMRIEPGSIQFNDQGKALGSITFSAFQA